MWTGDGLWVADLSGESGREERGLTWEGGSVARGLGTPVTAGRRRERCMERGGRRRAVARLRCPSLDSSPAPGFIHPTCPISTRRPPGWECVRDSPAAPGACSISIRSCSCRTCASRSRFRTSASCSWLEKFWLAVRMASSSRLRLCRVRTSSSKASWSSRSVTMVSVSAGGTGTAAGSASSAA